MDPVQMRAALAEMVERRNYCYAMYRESCEGEDRSLTTYWWLQSRTWGDALELLFLRAWLPGVGLVVDEWYSLIDLAA